jgi:hypothetical protein
MSSIKGTTQQQQILQKVPLIPSIERLSLNSLNRLSIGALSHL